MFMLLIILSLIELKQFDKTVKGAYPQCRFVEGHGNWICYFFLCHYILHKLPIMTQEMYFTVKQV